MKYQESEYEVLFKGTDSNMQCRGFQYELNKEYVIDNDRPIELCRNGFHACNNPELVDNFYRMFSFSKNRLFRIKGHVVNKYDYIAVCDSIIFVEEINLEELLEAVKLQNYDYPYIKYYSGAFLSNIQWKVKSIAEYEKLQTYEDRVSYLLKDYWSTKYLTIRQMNLLVDSLSSACLMHKFLFFNHNCSSSLYELIRYESFPKLRKILAWPIKKTHYHSNCSKNYEKWYSDNLKRNSRKKSKNS
jgi:hypothetical protein